MIKLCVFHQYTALFLGSHNKSALSFILPFLFHHFPPHSSVSLVFRCGPRAGEEALPIFFFPALVDLLLYLLKLTREHPSLFPAAIMPTWPLKHIKNPAGDRETVGSVLYFLRLHHQPPLWHRHVCLPQGIESGGGRGDISWDILLTQTILWLTNKSSPHFTVYQWKSIIVLLALPSPAEVPR